MNYKTYPKAKEIPQRMARKRARRDVFTANKKASKLRRKIAKAARTEDMSYES